MKGQKCVKMETRKENKLYKVITRNVMTVRRKEQTHCPSGSVRSSY